MRRALVTGGHVGLGFEIAKELCNRMYNVVVIGRKVKDPGATLYRHGAFSVVQERVDIGVGYQCTNLVKNYGPFDIVVNNANEIRKGTVGAEGCLEPDSMQQMLRTNCTGMYNVVKATWDRMVKLEMKGLYINISSLGANDPLPELTAYGATKAFVETYSKGMVAAGACKGIRTVVARLGAVATSTLFGLYPQFDRAKAQDPASLARRLVKLSLDADNGEVIQFALPNQKEGFNND